MANKTQKPQTKVMMTVPRAIGNVVFYVDHIGTQTKETGVWNVTSYMVRVKHYNNNKPAFPFDHHPSNEELARLWRWR
jgi:hypothetical protein